MALTETEPVALQWKDIKAALEPLGIAVERVRDIHIEVGRLTVTTVIELPEGTRPRSEDSIFKLTTYPIVLGS